MKILIAILLTSATCFGAFTNIVGGVDTLGTWMDKINAGFGGVVNLKNDSSVIVKRGSTDTASYEALVSAYEYAKLLTPSGSALSSSNRASVLIPPGIYNAGTNELHMDTSFVDLIAMEPDALNIDVTSFDPPRTRIIGQFLNGSGLDGVVVVDVDDIRIKGLSIENHGFYNSIYISETNGSPSSIYYGLYLYDAHEPQTKQVCDLDFSGIWIDCVAANKYAWRLDQSGNDRYFSAKMYNCHADEYSFGGDYNPSDTNDHEFASAYFYRCTSPAKSFGGCDTFGIATDANTKFIECELPGGNGFSLSADFAGSLIRCTGRENCGGTGELIASTFSGYAEDCNFGPNSLGGLDGTNSGVMVGCVITNSTSPINLLGATIDNSIFSVSSSGTNLFVLHDDNTIMRNNTLLVNNSGSGVQIYSGSSVTAEINRCVFNIDESEAIHTNVFNSVSITETETFTIMEPDLRQAVNDLVLLKKFSSDKYPRGVTVKSIYIGCLISYTSETFIFQASETASGFPLTIIETIVASGTDTEDDGDLSNPSVDANDYIMVDLDDTPENVPLVSITITWTIN